MRKMWLVALTTYRKRVRSGMFLILTFGLPVLMIAAGAVGFLVASPDGGDGPTTIGYVNHTDQLAPVETVSLEEDLIDVQQTLDFVAYESVDAAEAAYLDGEIGGFLLIPDDYFEGQPVTYYSDEEAGTSVEEGLRLFLRRSLLVEQPQWLFERLDDAATYTYVAQGNGETVSEGVGLVIRLATPAFLAIVFVLAVVFGTSQMGAAIIQEKDQRAMEMIITSLRPVELVGGKVLGLTLLSLTQFAIWAGGGIIALFLGFSDQLSLQGLALPWNALFWGLLLIIPGYFLYALLAAGLGIIAGDAQQAQQLAGIMSLLGFAPIYVLGPILANPDGPLALGLTLFPLTSPSVALMRTVFTGVPTWQLAAAFAILVVSLALTIWLVTRIFRAAMLNYGKALRPHDVWRALLQA